jgi:hypothetical protein
MLTILLAIVITTTVEIQTGEFEDVRSVGESVPGPEEDVIRALIFWDVEGENVSPGTLLVSQGLDREILGFSPFETTEPVFLQLLVQLAIVVEFYPIEFDVESGRGDIRIFGGSITAEYEYPDVVETPEPGIGILAVGLLLVQTSRKLNKSG